jgi:anti-sigma factor RsiW
LIGTLDPDDYPSFEHTLDFRCFAYYAEHGRSAPRDALTSLFEALHDNSITQATLALLKGGRASPPSWAAMTNRGDPLFTAVSLASPQRSAAKDC